MDAAKIMASLRFIDEQHLHKTVLHSINPAAHLIVVLSFITIALSFQKYEPDALVPLIFFPLFMLIFGEISAGPILRRVAVVTPAVLLIGAANPFLDKNSAIVAGFQISVGWLSLLVLLIKCTLTAAAALLLVCVSGIDGICSALYSIRAPKLIVAQLAFTYRYIHTLGEEAVNVMFAYRLRAPGRRGVSLKGFGPMAGGMFLRSMKHADSVYSAMLCRGFSGVMPVSSNLRFALKDFCYILFWLTFFVLARIYNLSQMLGSLITTIS